MSAHPDPANPRDGCPMIERPVHPPAIGDDTEHQTLWWKQALRQIAAAALRLHHYRYVRTRIFHDALSRGESCQSVCVSKCDHAVNKH